MPVLSMIFCNLPQVKIDSRFIYSKHQTMFCIIFRKRINMDSWYSIANIFSLLKLQFLA